NEIPSSVGGKLQRRRLHEKIECVPSASGGSALAFSGTEARVARLFAGVLDRPVTRPDDNFLALGGDSLSAARLTHWVNENWGVELSASAVLTAPTVRAFAALLQAAIRDADALGDALQTEIDRLTDEDIERLLHQSA